MSNETSTDKVNGVVNGVASPIVSKTVNGVATDAKEDRLNGKPPLQQRSSDNDFREVLTKGLATSRRSLWVVAVSRSGSTC